MDSLEWEMDESQDSARLFAWMICCINSWWTRQMKPVGFASDYRVFWNLILAAIFRRSMIDPETMGGFGSCCCLGYHSVAAPRIS
jgi:hypothetical protein